MLSILIDSIFQDNFSMKSLVSQAESLLFRFPFLGILLNEMDNGNWDAWHRKPGFNKKT